MNLDNLKVLSDTYLEQLHLAVAKYPERYPWAHSPTTTVCSNLGPVTTANKSVEEVANRMITAFVYGTANIDSPAWKGTCKALGVKHTKKALCEYIGLF